MQFLIDHITATLMTLVLVVILVAMQLRVNQVSADRTALYISKKQTLEFAEFLTRELSNLGANLPAGERIDKISQNAAGLTDTLRFWRVNAANDTLEIAYVLTVIDSVLFYEKATDTMAKTAIYQLNRFQDDVPQGGSPPTLRDFRIRLLNDAGAAQTSSFNDVRQIQISFSNLVPYGTDSDDHYVPETYWATTLRPNTLR